MLAGETLGQSSFLYIETQLKAVTTLTYLI
jgi:hypothetical protein